MEPTTESIELPQQSIIQNEQQSMKFQNFQTNSEICELWKEKCDQMPETVNNINLNIRSESFNEHKYTNSNANNVDDLEMMDISIIKQTVDHNDKLIERLNKLQKQERDLTKKMKKYNKRLKKKQNEIIEIQKNSSNMTGTRRTTKMEPNLIRKVFSQAQINYLLGKEKVVWSYDDMAMAFTLRHIASKECYLYLKNTLNIPLPSLSSVQKWISASKS